MPPIQTILLWQVVVCCVFWFSMDRFHLNAESEPNINSTRPSDEKIHLQFIGDSHTAMGHWPKACLEVLRQRYTTSSNILARSGLRPDEAFVLLRSDVWRPKPSSTYESWALVLLGTNAYQPEVVVEVAQYLRVMGFRVLVMATPPRRPKKVQAWTTAHANEKFNQRLKQIIDNLGDRNIHFIDFPDVLLDTDRAKKIQGQWLSKVYNRDGTHLKVSGYRLLGRSMGQFLLEHNRKKDRSAP